jgi:deazaflavin-dependent oxidoreductase (nitroreductase family)
MAVSDFPRPDSFLFDMIRSGQDRSSKAVRLLMFVNRFVAPLYMMYVLPLLGFGRILLLLTTKGRKTGRKRRTPLEYQRINGVIHLLSSRGDKADWILNVRAHPDDIWVQVGFHSFHVRVEIIRDISEVEDFMRWYSINHPNFARAFYGWDAKRDDPDTADFSSFAEQLILLRVHHWG